MGGGGGIAGCIFCLKGRTGGLIKGGRGFQKEELISLGAYDRMYFFYKGGGGVYKRRGIYARGLMTGCIFWFKGKIGS